MPRRIEKCIDCSQFQFAMDDYGLCNLTGEMVPAYDLPCCMVSEDDEEDDAPWDSLEGDDVP